MSVREDDAHLHAERTQRRLAAVLTSSPAAILILGRDGSIESLNPGAEALYGCPAGEVLGRCAYEALPPETATHLRALVEQLERGEPATGLAATHDRHDGTRSDVSVTGSVIRSAAGAVDGYCILSVDITRRRQAEAEVAEALDGERQRIGRELHDTLGQQITAIGMLLNTLRSELGTGSASASTLHNLEEVVGQVKSQLRLLIRGVFPVAVDSEGLLWALYDLAHETSELFGVGCRVDNDPDVAVADNFWATELYWIAREAVHNAVHHGRARDITIELAVADELVLAVRDNGCGIPAKIDETRTLGLRTMRHRCSIIGGRFSIARAPEGGTVVKCVIPLVGSRGSVRSG